MEKGHIGKENIEKRDIKKNIYIGKNMEKRNIEKRYMEKGEM